MKPRFRLHFFELLCIVQVILTRWMMARTGLGTGGFAGNATLVGKALAIMALEALIGVAIVALWSRLRGDRGYLRAIRRPRWWITTARLVIGSTMIVYSYGWLKVLVPLIHPRLFDQELWNLDQLIFFGLSPSVFLVNLLSNPALMRVIDSVYGPAFLTTLLGAQMIFVALKSDRMRIAFANGSAALWSSAVWLYILVPTLGPVYRFTDVWDPYWTLLGHSKHLQYLLLKNYQEVLKARQGLPVQNIDIMLGIAGFPSMHVAYQTYVALWVRQLSRPAGTVFLVGVIALFLGSIVTGWHYLLDGLAALAMAFLAFYVPFYSARLQRWARRRG